jgi:hypothetical protein
MPWREFVGALLAAAVWLVSAPVWAQEAAGTIEGISGSVAVTRDGRTEPAQTGMQLLPADRIATGRGSFAEIKLRDNTLLTMGPDCRMRITRFSFDSDTNAGNMLLTLIKGSLRVTTGLIGRHDPSAVQFRTLVGNIGIRGTQFIVESGERY